MEDHDIENFTTPFSNLIEEELSEGKIMKRTEETKMRKRTQSRVIRYHRVVN